MIGIGLVCLAIGAAMGLVMILMLDPACGPDGASQIACVKELIHDIVGR